MAITDVGAPVFLSDSGLCILTPTEVFVGYVAAYITTNTCWVKLGDNPPDRFIVALPIPASTASAGKNSYVVWTAPRSCKVMAAWATALAFPDYATSVIDIDKYDLGTTADKEVVAAADIDGDTAKQITSLTLTSTAADLLLAAGDTLRASATVGATEATPSDGLTAIVELQWYGPANM